MERAEFETKVERIIMEKMGVSTVKQEDHLFNDIGMDSLDAVEFLMAIEDEYDLELEDSVAEKAKTVKDVVDFLVSVDATNM